MAAIRVISAELAEGVIPYRHCGNGMRAFEMVMIARHGSRIFQESWQRYPNIFEMTKLACIAWQPKATVF
ncbi:hypothetical protein V3C99_010567 [Haemonchus contortus]